MLFQTTGKPRPTIEDHLRGVGYLTICLWAVLFTMFPPVAFAVGLHFYTRLFWLSITFTGALIAAVGAFRRIDLKMEFPGLILTHIGPFFYFLGQVYYFFNPADGDLVNSRTAFMVYAILPGILILPRTVGLHLEIRKAKRLAQNNALLAKKAKVAEEEKTLTYSRRLGGHRP